MDEQVQENKIRPKRGRGGTNNFLTNPEVAPGVNSRFTNFAMQVAKHKNKVNLADPQAVEERIEEYFQLCAANDMKPGVMGLALAMGMDRAEIYKYRTGVIGSTRPEVCTIIKKAYIFVEYLWESMMQNGQINPVSGIFIGKNHYGYQDKQEFDITPRNPLGDTVDPREIQARLVGMDDE